MEQLIGMLPEELEAFVVSLGEKPFRARQILSWICRRGAADIDGMTDLSRSFRERLAEAARIGLPEVLKVSRAADGTTKLLLSLEDGRTVESVIIPDEGRTTLCVSSQVGCGLACAFCLTGRLGFLRNLSAAEIVGQVIVANNYLRERGGGLTNIVFMGMGEPLLNFDEVRRALVLILSGRALSFSWRHVTVSTAGIPEGIRRLGDEILVNLAVSLNAPDDETRTAIMPINRKYPLGALTAALFAYPLKRGRRITLEYVLLSGVNDTVGHARALARLVGGLRVKINLIPFNPFDGAPFARPDDEAVLRFQEVLLGAHLFAVVRKSKGADIGAACGQLAAGSGA
jgi:23S rRNA (adenine2503-C2)-methyltransferase